MKSKTPSSGATTSFNLRQAQREDAPALVRLIIALAEFEKLPLPNAEAQVRLIQDGFGNSPRFETWLAFANCQSDPVGYAIVFETYSTFLARPTLYLEDLFVLPAFRGRGIGSALLWHCVQTAYERGCGRMEWTCLDWNTKAQSFYEGVGAECLSDWRLYRLTRDRMAKNLSQSQFEHSPRSNAES